RSNGLLMRSEGRTGFLLKVEACHHCFLNLFSRKLLINFSPTFILNVYQLLQADQSKRLSAISVKDMHKPYGRAADQRLPEGIPYADRPKDTF
ncbi:MAG: hypothetical protein KAI75_06605, partial [Desulfobulbaceae bacterium]|nr:hypothetical protein [Desulfobulbaceae bacterium]